MIDLLAWTIVALAALILFGLLVYLLLVTYYRLRVGDWREARRRAWEKTKRAVREAADWLPVP